MLTAASVFEEYSRPKFFAFGVICFARPKISSTGIAFDVPVAFISGLSISLITPAATGAETAQKNTGISDSWFTIL